MWVPGNSDIYGNEKADELARLGTESSFIKLEPSIHNSKKVTKFPNSTMNQPSNLQSN